jgi:GNAT superfamily N-acetyltransferase
MDDTPAPSVTVRRLHAIATPQLEQLSDVLVDCVEGGASVSFMLPFPREKALAFWRRVGEDLARGERALLVAEDETGIVGTVQLALAQPENQPHRADLAKLLVHRRARRHGIAERLMRAAEPVARDCGKTLLVLDTASDTAARLYARLGWVEAGVVPGYALLPAGGPCKTTFFWRTLD